MPTSQGRRGGRWRDHRQDHGEIAQLHDRRSRDGTWAVLVGDNPDGLASLPSGCESGARCAGRPTDGRGSTPNSRSGSGRWSTTSGAHGSCARPGSRASTGADAAAAPSATRTPSPAPIWSTGTSPSMGRTSSGAPISPSIPPGEGRCTAPQFSTLIRGVLWVVDRRQHAHRARHRRARHGHHSPQSRTILRDPAF